MQLVKRPMDASLKGFPVVIEVPVAWGDMDALQHVNNVVYFRYFENARIAYFEAIKYWQTMEETGIGPILASTKCRFKAPLTYPDSVLVGARTSELKQDRFVMEYCAVSRNLQKVAAEGEGVLVSFNYREKKKAPLPRAVVQVILELEGTGEGALRQD